MLLAWGIDPESRWFEEGVRFVFTIIIGGPLVALLWALFGLGGSTPSQDVHGYTVLRLRPGMRVTLSVLALALAGLMQVGARDGDMRHVAWVFHLFTLFFLWGGWVIFTAKIRFDGSTLYAPGPLGGTRRYDWADLIRIEQLPDTREYRLVFTGKRSAKISYFYSGVERLISLANERRRGNAGTP